MQAINTRSRFDVIADGHGLCSHAGVVLLADGGDCVRDLAGLRDQSGLFGRVCSTPTAWRVVHEVAADPRGWRRCGAALARVRRGHAFSIGFAIDADAHGRRPGAWVCELS